MRPAAYISLAGKSWDWVDEHRDAGRGCLDDRSCIAGVIDPECCRLEMQVLGKGGSICMCQLLIGIGLSKKFAVVLIVQEAVLGDDSGHIVIGGAAVSGKCVMKEVIIKSSW